MKCKIIRIWVGSDRFNIGFKNHCGCCVEKDYKATRKSQGDKLECWSQGKKSEFPNDCIWHVNERGELRMTSSIWPEEDEGGVVINWCGKVVSQVDWRCNIRS